MRALNRLLFRLRNLLRRERVEREMEDELRLHQELQRLDNLQRGMSEGEASRKAAQRLGTLDSVKEDCRDSWGVRFADMLSQDLRFAWRSLARNRGYAAAVVLTLGLGIGANTSFFSLVRGVLLKPLPYAEGDRLVVLRQPVPQAGVESLNFSVKEIEDYRAQNRSLDRLVEHGAMSSILAGAGEPLPVFASVVSADFFEAFEVAPVLGRTFRPGEDKPEADQVMLLSFEFWRRAFGADARVVGRMFRMNDRPITVIGVLPPLPPVPFERDVYVPTSASPWRMRPLTLEKRGSRGLLAFARLKPGVGIDEARSDLERVQRQLRLAYPDVYPKNAEPRFSVALLREELVHESRATLLLLFGIAGVVLLLACANVANLTLARLGERGQELAVRSVLGAGRARILRQLATETTLLALVGGLLALAFSAATHGTLVRFASRFTARAVEIQLDHGVWLFAFALSAFTGIAIGSLRYLAGPDAPAQALTAEGRATAGPRRQRLRASLVACQSALSLMLVVGAALTLRSLHKLRDVDPGFRREGALTARVDIDLARYLTPERRFDNARFYALHDGLLAAARALPGVTAAGCGLSTPLSRDGPSEQSFKIDGRSDDEPASPTAVRAIAGVGYFEALGVPLLRGRFFEEHDRAVADDVVIINRPLARKYFGDADPLERRLSTDGRSWRTIVGVVGDVHHGSLASGANPALYAPLLPASSLTLLVRTPREPLRLEPAIRASVQRLDPHAAVAQVRTLEQLFDNSLESQRLTTSLLTLFGALALAISGAGVGGVVAYTVGRRTREIGIRLALGATPRRILDLVVKQGLTPVVVGAALGLLGALVSSHLLRGLLFGVEPADPLCFAGATAVLLLTASAACLLPARRATLVDPTTALRRE